MNRQDVEKRGIQPALAVMRAIGSCWMFFEIFGREIYLALTRRARGRYFLDTYRSPVGMSYFFGRLEIMIANTRVRRIVSPK